MKTFEVRYTVDGRTGYSVIVSAPNSNSARQVAMGKIQGEAGFIGKKIRISSVHEIR